MFDVYNHKIGEWVIVNAREREKKKLLPYRVVMWWIQNEIKIKMDWNKFLHRTTEQRSSCDMSVLKLRKLLTLISWQKVGNQLRKEAICNVWAVRNKRLKIKVLFKTTMVFFFPQNNKFFSKNKPSVMTI